MSMRMPGLGTAIARWLVAYLVVLQAFLGGLAAGAMAAPATGDAFTLCLSAASQDDGAADHGGGTASPVFHTCNACPLAGGVPLLLTLPEANRLPAFAIATAAAPDTARVVAAIPLSESARPRAPPRLS